MINAGGLLQTINGLSFGDRQRLLAEYARRLAGSAELAGVLDDLHGQGEFARQIAVQLAGIAGEPEYVERCVSGVETSVLRQALNVAIRLSVPVAVLAARLPTLPSAVRIGLYQQIRRRGATELAETLLPLVRDRFGDQEAALLLPVCTPETVAAVLPELEYAVTGWGRIGRRHPDVFLDYVDTALAATPRSGWTRLLSTVGAGLAVAALAEPDRVLALLERVVPDASLPGAIDRTMGALARHDPPRLLAVLLHPRRDGYLPGGRKLWEALLGASDAELAALGRALGGWRLQRFLRVLPPARRAGVYSGAIGDRTPTAAGLPWTVLDLLPAAVREERARWLLSLRAVADDPTARLAVTARLPWSQAREPLLDATRKASAQERAEAYTCLVGAAAASRDPQVFAGMLGSLSRLTNEQDPVRQTALQALAEVPPWLFRTVDLTLVASLMTDAAQARDCSNQTQQAVRKLAGRLIREGALTRQPALVDTGLGGLSALGQNRPWLPLSRLDHDLPRGGEHQVFEALRPRLERDARRGRFEMTLSLTDGLGRRAWAMPDLQELVGKARKAADDHVVRTAITLWLRPPATRDERLAEVFRADRSTIVIPAVQDGIGWLRTDLLDEVFSTPLHGRFLKKNHRYVPTFSGCFHRWLPRQAAAYTELVGGVAALKKASPWERAAAVRRLGPIPGTADRVREFLTDTDIMVVEAALGALAWTGEPAQVLPDLLAHVDNDRARVAVYAATRCVRYVPPDQLAAALAPALTARKVTSRKEAVRLLAAHHATGAAEALAAAWAEPDQHRDVRRALVSAACRLLDDERVWPLLTAAASTEHAVATAVLDLDPHTIAERHRPRYVALVRAVADAADPDTARLGLTALSTWTRWDTASTELLADRVTNLASTATWRPALRTLVTNCTVTEDPEPLRAVATRLAEAAGAIDAPGPDRDLPARQRILVLADTIRTGATTSSTLRQAAAVLADTLTGSPTLRRPAIELAVAAVPLDPTADDTTALLRVTELADTPLWAWHAHHALRDAVSQRMARIPQNHLHNLATTLATHPTSPAAQLLAVAIASHAGTETGWPPHWLELIANLRHHPHADVRLAALDTFTTTE